MAKRKLEHTKPLPKRTKLSRRKKKIRIAKKRSNSR